MCRVSRCLHTGTVLFVVRVLRVLRFLDLLFVCFADVLMCFLLRVCCECDICIVHFSVWCFVFVGFRVVSVPCALCCVLCVLRLLCM